MQNSKIACSLETVSGAFTFIRALPRQLTPAVRHAHWELFSSLFTEEVAQAVCREMVLLKGKVLYKTRQRKSREHMISYTLTSFSRFSHVKSSFLRALITLVALLYVAERFSVSSMLFSVDKTASCIPKNLTCLHRCCQILKLVHKRNSERIRHSCLKQ